MPAARTPFATARTSTASAEAGFSVSRCFRAAATAAFHSPCRAFGSGL